MAINIQSLADIAHFITENNLQGMICIIDIFHHFRNFDISTYEFRIYIFIQFTEFLLGILAICTNQSQRRVQIIMYRGSFTKEFRIGYHSKCLATLLAGCLFYDLTYFFIGSGQYCTTNGNDMIGFLRFYSFSYLSCYSVNIAKV